MEEKETKKARPDAQNGNGKQFHRHKNKHHRPHHGAQNQQKPQAEGPNAYRHVSADQAFAMHEDGAQKKQPQAAPAQKNQNPNSNAKQQFHKRHRGKHRHPSQKPQDAESVKELPISEQRSEKTPFVETAEPTASEFLQETAPAPIPNELPLRQEEAISVPEVAEQKEPVEQTEIVGVHFKTTAKVYYFDPKGMQIRRGTHVIVQTANGDEYGEVTVANRKIPNTELVLPLRPVLRVANEQDEAIQKENADREIEAYNICLQRIEQHQLDMKLVDTELSFDRSKLIFYFTSEDRVDFRELVKELAATFRIRIEMRQIGIRDEAKMLGGLGICGRPFCCSTFLPDFAQVSIKMAKEQNLSLNSAKISGSCGRLMCCLRYEHSTYEEELKITPKVDSFVTTADGDGVVVESNPLTGLLKVRLNDEENTRVYARESVTVTGHQKGASRRQLEALRQQQQQNKQQLQQKREEKKAAMIAQNQAQKETEEAKNNQNPKKS